MEGGGGGEEEKKKSSTVMLTALGTTLPAPPPQEGGETKSKRKMKTASQLEMLEKTYAEEPYPSEAVRAELSVKLGLSDRQLQMWFCHRRLKDRKAPPVKRQRKDSLPVGPVGVAVTMPGHVKEEVGVSGEVSNDHTTEPELSPFGHAINMQRIVPRVGITTARMGGDVPSMKRYYESPQSIMELRAIAFVEAQLGEPLREDGPILGMEFDPLPPDAFGAPLGAVGQQKQSVRSYEAKGYEWPDAKPVKGAARALHEYQFLPEQPTVRTDTYERATPSHYYVSPTNVPNPRPSPLSAGRPFMHGSEQVPAGYNFQGQVASLSLLQQGRTSLMPSTSGEYDGVSQKYVTMDAHFGTPTVAPQDNPHTPSERRIVHEEDASRLERKRKSEEAKIAKEVEAHEKRIRKELEKQDILRRKREEQMRKEMERQDRERRKEEERLLREKQREEERFQREQRREMERREKFLMKESIRAEKMRQKEELRREKEAAKLKAANDRAITRRLAKESMELIEDERLELMELAASSKGLPSLLSLDYETLQHLDSFRDMLAAFPPKSVKLKKPFATQPWANSEENVGNLLMVWRFLITFTDVLGLWPFTLDEFIQAFHDYDPRLLGEIHIALLRSIIKDIEDVARAPSIGSAANQNSSANIGGGHPQIVEGAFAWGFDICSWQQKLNPLTWPEILRQFALSAGFGPKLKRSMERAYVRDDNEANDGEDIISNLRNGVAAENALAIMQERGYTNQRKSRHRLTPGTVKFAAFHVLSLQGGKGLTILEVADKIQKSGLRDLTTSKTPEASIAAALSRDSILFERIAPSTYCVRTPYRKDPADAKAILSAAREKIRIFTSGYLDGEDADDVERDEESESDAAEDPEVDDLGNETNIKKMANCSYETERSRARSCSENGKGSLLTEVLRTSLGSLRNTGDDFYLMHSEGLSEKGANASICENATHNQEETDIDESNSGEPWVQGLAEGEYSDLSVEERLNALVALLDVAIAGNSIRTVLEERLEAANAVKKQMWAEAQLDKRRMKDECVTKTNYPSSMGNKPEPNSLLSAPEGKEGPSLLANNKNDDMPASPAGQQELINDAHDTNYFNSCPSERSLLLAQDISAGPENPALQQAGFSSEKSRAQLKLYIGHKAEEMYVYRSLPLGQDRRRNRYWQFITSLSPNDPGCGRIFVELREGSWRLIDSVQAFDALLASLDVRGIRESYLHSVLQKIESPFKETLKRKSSCFNGGFGGNIIGGEICDINSQPDCCDSPSNSICTSTTDTPELSSSFAVELGSNEAEKCNALERYRDFHKWMWMECLDSSSLCALKYGKKRCTQLLGICDRCHNLYFFAENHCPSCHHTFRTSGSKFNFSEHVALCAQNQKDRGSAWNVPESFPPRLTMVKAQLALVEVSVPSVAIQPVWTDECRRSWGMKLLSASSAEDLLQVLTMLESVIKRDHLSRSFETSNELLGYSGPATSATHDSWILERVPVLPWIPQTTAALALRLRELDSSIFYVPHQKELQRNKGYGNIIKLASKSATATHTEDAHAETQPEAKTLQENWFDPLTRFGNFRCGGRGGGRGRSRGRSRGGRSERRAAGLRSGPGRSGVGTRGFRKVPRWKGRTRGRGRGGRRRGRRTGGIRQKPVKTTEDVSVNTSAVEEVAYDKMQSSYSGDEWNEEPTRMQVAEMENTSTSGRSEYGDDDDDDTGQATGDEFDRTVVDDYGGGGSYSGRSDDSVDLSDGIEDDTIDEDDDDQDEEEDYEEEEEEENVDVERYINDEDGMENDIPDEAIGSVSSDYSSD